MKNDLIKSIVVLVSICLVVGLLLSGVNSITAPIIKEQEAAANSAAYADILPGATNLVEVEGTFPATVTKMMKDEGGAGYVFEAVTKGYTGTPINLLVSVDATGNIVKFDITNDTYPESKGSAEDFEALYTGKVLPPADFIAGCTISSNAYKSALNDIFTVFCEYAGVEKSDEQKLADLYATIMPNAKDKSGTLTFNAIDVPEGASSSIVAVYEPVCKTGYIVHAKSGDISLAAGVNAYGKVFYLSDLDGNDMLSNSAYTSLIDEIEAALPSIYETNNDAIVTAMIENGIITKADDAQKVDFSKVSNGVVAVYNIGEGNAYVAKSEGYGGVITVCYVINANGEIVNYATLEQNEEAELHYMNSEFGTVIAKPEYADKLVGKDTSTLAEEDIIIAGSSFTSSAVKTCWNDIKAAATIMNGEVAQ